MSSPMQMQVIPGDITGSMLGMALKEIIKRAMYLINKLRFDFVASEKIDDSGKRSWVTDADKKAQELYVKLFREILPGFGLVGEEQKLRIACTLPSHMPRCRIAIDPIDGTSSYTRYQSHGVGTQFAILIGDEIVSAFVGDVFSGEIYYYRPFSDKVHRIEITGDRHVQLSIDPGKTLKEQYLLLPKLPQKLSRTVEHMVAGEFFKDVEITGGSIGIKLARLWKGEVGGVIIDGRANHPWDILPVIGISQKLGFIFIKLRPDGYAEVYEPVISDETQYVDHHTLVVHSSRLHEVRKFLNFHQQA